MTTENMPSGIGTNPIARERAERSQDTMPQSYAPPVRDWQAKYDDPVPDPGYLIYTNEDWRTEHHNMDQIIKLGLQQVVGPQYVITGVRRGPRVTFLVANPWVPGREQSPGYYTEEEIRGRIGNAAYLDSVPNVAIRRDLRMR